MPTSNSIDPVVFIMLNKKKNPITTADVFPELSEELRAETEYTIRRYLEVVKRIYEYVAEYDSKSLTELRRRARLRKKREKAHI